VAVISGWNNNNIYNRSIPNYNRFDFFTLSLTGHLTQKFMQNIISFIVSGFIRASPKRLLISLLNARNIDFDKNNTPTVSLNGYPNIAVLCSGFFASQK
jgi:hypothetical protein